jgi:hypothetical protein
MSVAGLGCRRMNGDKSQNFFFILFEIKCSNFNIDFIIIIYFYEPVIIIITIIIITPWP